MIEILVKLLIVSFLLNVLWEFSHSRLYDTCLKMSWKKCAPLLLVMSAKDGFYIMLFYSLTAFLYWNVHILQSNVQLLTFIVFCLSFSYVDERISIKRKRWTYSRRMPLVLGVGFTPLLELAVTGVLTLMIIL